MDYYSDRAIQARIKDAISKYNTVSSDVTNGTVLLTGTVEQTEDLKQIKNLINQIEGVKAINDQVQIRGLRIKPSKKWRNPRQEMLTDPKDHHLDLGEKPDERPYF